MLIFGLLALAACQRPREAGRALSIAVVPKGTTAEFWNSVHAGAVKAERELRAEGLNVTITWKGPLREDDREQQVQVVEGFTSQGISGLVLAPLDDRALVRPIEEAKAAGVPTVIIDSALQSDQIVSFVATDNYKGGQLAADRLAEAVAERGKVLLLRTRKARPARRHANRAFSTA